MATEVMVIVGLVATSGLVGGVVATLVQLYFENRRLKIERESALNKEIYFKKVEAWGKISVQMLSISAEISQYITALSGEPAFFAKLNISIDERIQELAVLEVWFFGDVKDAWNKINEPYNIIRQTYLLFQQGKMSPEQSRLCVEAISRFSDASLLFKKEIRLELEKDRAKII